MEVFWPTTYEPAHWSVNRIEKNEICDHSSFSPSRQVKPPTTTRTSHGLYDDSTAAYGQRKVCWRVFKPGSLISSPGGHSAVNTNSYVVRTTSESSLTTRQQLSGDCVLPTNWGDLTNSEKAEANPCGCSLPELVRADTGHCLADASNINKIEIEMHVTQDAATANIWVWTYSGDRFNPRNQSIQWYMVPSRDSNTDCQTNAAAVVGANEGTTQASNEVYEYVIPNPNVEGNTRLEKIKLCFYVKSKSGKILSDGILVAVPTDFRERIFAD